MKITLLVVLALAIGLFTVWAIPQSNQDVTVSGSYKDIYYRLDNLEAKIGNLQKINKLEAEVAELQNRIKELESKSKVMTVPLSQIPPGTQMPPGSKSHEFNGMKFWTIPLGDK